MVGVRVIGEAGQATYLQAFEQPRAITFAIEEQGEAMAQRFGREHFGARLAREILLQTRQNLSNLAVKQSASQQFMHHLCA